MKRVIAGLLLTAGLVGACGGGSDKPSGSSSQPEQSAAQFIEQVMRDRADGKDVYAALHPAQQALITKAQFSACDPTGVDVVSFKAVETNEETAEPIPGTDVESAAWAVTAKYKVKRGTQEAEDTDTFRAYKVDGAWVWALDQNGLDQTLNGTC